MEFPTLIKTYTKKALVSGDSCFSITLYARDLDVSALDMLAQADSEVQITIEARQ